MDHLRHRADFQAVMAAEVVSRTPHFVLHRRLANTKPPIPAADAMCTPADSPIKRSRVGAVLPKRLARRAVTRNALKRQIYNVMTAFESRLPLGDHVVRLRAPFDRGQFVSATSAQLKQAARLELEQLLSRVVQP
ncbi:MAG: ribonuclease P protein component [Limnohabitans sp.]